MDVLKGQDSERLVMGLPLLLEGDPLVRGLAPLSSVANYISELEKRLAEFLILTIFVFVYAEERLT